MESPSRTSENCSLLTFEGKAIGRKAKNITDKEWVRLKGVKDGKNIIGEKFLERERRESERERRKGEKEINIYLLGPKAPFLFFFSVTLLRSSVAYHVRV